MSLTFNMMMIIKNTNMNFKTIFFKEIFKIMYQNPFDSID
jgi:hypothetical protein